MTREEMIEAILNNMACGNNDSPLSRHVRRNLEKQTDKELRRLYRVFVLSTDE